MAYIDSFQIQGLAGNEAPLERQLHRTLNVFWGLNGGGKTSVLKILHGAMDNDASQLKRVPFTRADVWIRDSANKTLVKRSITVPDDLDPTSEEDEIEGPAGERLVAIGDGLWQEIANESNFVWSTEVLEGDPVRLAAENARFKSRFTRNREFEHAYLPISRLSRPTYRGRLNRWDSPFSDQTLDDAFAEQIADSWRQYTQSFLTAIQAIQQKGLSEILATLFQGEDVQGQQQPSQEDTHDAREVVAMFLQQQNFPPVLDDENFARRFQSDPLLPRIVEQIRGVQAEIQEVTRPQETLQAIIGEMYRGKKQLRLTAPGRLLPRSLRVDLDGKIIPLQSLSSGEKQLLRLLLEVLSADDKTVMIDEPELSMHVDWQLRLIDSMQRVNPKCQLLLATHSPEIVSQAPDECVFEL